MLLHHLSKKFIIFLMFSCLLFKRDRLAAFELKHPDKFVTVEQLEGSEGKNKVIKTLKENNINQFVLLMHKGVVINEGGIITADGRILRDVQTSIGNKDQHRLLGKNRDINTENPLYFKGKLAVLSSPGSENWYHWLLQILPRLLILKESQIEFDKIFVNNLQFPWQKESLELSLKMLNIPQDKLLIVNGDCIIQAEELVVPSVPFIPAKNTPMHKWMQNFLHNRAVR